MARLPAWVWWLIGITGTDLRLLSQRYPEWIFTRSDKPGYMVKASYLMIGREGETTATSIDGDASSIIRALDRLFSDPQAPVDQVLTDMANAFFENLPEGVTEEGGVRYERYTMPAEEENGE